MDILSNPLYNHLKNDPSLQELPAKEGCHAFVVSELPPAKKVQQLSQGRANEVYWRGSYHVSCQHGNKVLTFIARTMKKGGNPCHPVFESILKAQRITQDLTGFKYPGWTFPQMARSINKWLEIYQPPLSPEKKKALVPHWHYQRVWPGDYPTCRMFDLTAAYWQTAERVPSPIVGIVGKHLLFGRLTKQQLTRWLATLDALKWHKPLRLSLIGANAAGWNDTQELWSGTRRFRDGLESTYSPAPGAMQALALLAVRCTYELTQEQWQESEKNGHYPFYANADCIAIEYLTADVDLWRRHGADYAVKQETHSEYGEVADPAGSSFEAIGAYRIGAYKTENYDFWKSRGQHKMVAAAPAVDPVYYPQVFKEKHQ